MTRSYNIGTECYALLTSSTDAEMLLPVKIVLLEKYTWHGRTTYKVKIKEIFETDFKFLKETLCGYKVSVNLKTENKSVLIKRTDIENMIGMGDLMTYLNDRPFFLEENYITLDKDGLRDLYERFVKYLINYHYKRLYQLTSRSFLANSPIYNNQKDVFMRRVERLGFGDVFQKNGIKLDI